MRRFGMKAIAVCLAMLCCTGLASQSFVRVQHAESATIAELEAQKKENNKKIKEFEAQLAQYEKNQQKQKEYQKALEQKITVLQDNMRILDEELEALNEKIYNLDIEIADLKQVIEQQKVDIEEGLETFKLRLRAMYVNGNDSLASALIGATDFYDLLSKYELITCVARHDDKLINDLKNQLESYNSNLASLKTQMGAL
ncbi:MAG: hypothetical protein IKC40_05850 [Oscillospiraceae bacterium]|nr:hypothetical protein [Oscillospiraceae bacterium]